MQNVELGTTPHLETEVAPLESRGLIREEEINKYSHALGVLDLEDQLSVFLLDSDSKERLLDKDIVGSEVVQKLSDRLDELSGKIADNITIVDAEDEQAMSDLTHLLIEKRRIQREGRRAVSADPSYFSTVDMQLPDLIRGSEIARREESESRRKNRNRF